MPAAGRIVVVGLGTTAKVILAVGTLAGGGLATWKLLQEVVETRKLGPPAWWVLWWKPLRPAAPAEADQRYASRAFRWKVDRWVPISEHWYALSPAVGSVLGGGPPEGRSLYAQAFWERKPPAGAWRLAEVAYAKDVDMEQLPSGGAS